MNRVVTIGTPPPETPPTQTLTEGEGWGVLGVVALSCWAAAADTDQAGLIPVPFLLLLIMLAADSVRTRPPDSGG